MTHDGAFGIDSLTHGVRLCLVRSSDQSRTCFLNEHFRRVHHLTPLASRALARAISEGQDPLTTRLFNPHQVILNLEELRDVSCPIHKPFVHYPSMDPVNFPCHEHKQVRHLKDHLRRVHRFTPQAANVIVKSIKANRPVHQIQFPHWMNIIAGVSSL